MKLGIWFLVGVLSAGLASANTYVDQRGITRQLLPLSQMRKHPNLASRALETWAPTTPATASLATWQTPIRDQGSRGTCWAFAAAAALEAQYRRQFNQTLDLSEQYIFHIMKAVELLTSGNRESNSSYWGFQGDSTTVEWLRYLYVMEEWFAPYQSEAKIDALRVKTMAGPLGFNATQEQIDALEFSTDHISRLARNQARYAVTTFEDVKSLDTASLEKIIAGGHEVIVDLDLKWKFDSTLNAMDYDSQSAGGGHVALLVGYDRPNQVFLMKNSFGGTDLTRVTYNFVKKCVLAGDYVTGVRDPKLGFQAEAGFVGSWNMDHDGWRGKLVIRRYIGIHQANPKGPTRLGSYYDVNGKRHDVNGHFFNGGSALEFYIAPGTGQTTPGDEKGQKFVVYKHSRNNMFISGTTEQAGGTFGVVISADPMPTGYSGAFNKNKWLGEWEMFHDGWRGKLSIKSIRKDFLSPNHEIVTASYVDANGKPQKAFGTYNPAAPTRMSIAVQWGPGSNQIFNLYFHGWEDKVFSGYTDWGGARYGVVGRK